MTRAWRTGLTLAVCAAAAPSLAFAQRLGGAPEFETPWLRLIVGLLLCTLVAALAAVVIRRFMHAGSPVNGRFLFLGAAPRRLRVIETHRLSAHADVCMFTCEGREYLVVVSAAGATVLRDEARPNETSP
jgi:hypothetical protein